MLLALAATKEEPLEALTCVTVEDQILFCTAWTSVASLWNYSPNFFQASFRFLASNESELGSEPLRRGVLSHPIVLHRTPDSKSQSDWKFFDSRARCCTECVFFLSRLIVSPMRTDLVLWISANSHWLAEVYGVICFWCFLCAKYARKVGEESHCDPTHRTTGSNGAEWYRSGMLTTRRNVSILLSDP